MHLFDAHMAQLKASTEANRCGATDTLPHLQALRMVANDLEPAFGDLGEDTRFAKHASDLRAVLDSTLAAPPLNCTGVGAAMGKIGEACKACHQDFRSQASVRATRRRAGNEPALTITTPPVRNGARLTVGSRRNA